MIYSQPDPGSVVAWQARIGVGTYTFVGIREPVVTACGDKVAYLSEHLANNAARLHQFVHPACDDIHAYACLDHWHIGHNLPAAGQRCKAEAPLRPRRDPHRPDTPPTRSKRGAA